MTIDDKIQAVEKVSQALDKQSHPESELTRSPPNKERFDALFDAAKNIIPQPIDANAIAALDARLKVPEEQVLVQPDNTAIQGNSSSTDKEHSDPKKKQQPEEEIDAVGSVRGNRAKTSKGSLFDEVNHLDSRVNKAALMNPDHLKVQAQDLIGQIETIKTQLNAHGKEVKSSYHTLLQNRLTHIDDNLKIALSKAGIEYISPAQAAQGTTNPISRFVNLLSNSQYQLEHLQQTIDQLNLTQGQLTPANMLALQIKVGYVQQQIELFVSLLNKALESTKTIMNVQV